MKTQKLSKEFCLVVTLDIMTCKSEESFKITSFFNNKSLEKNEP